MKYHSVSQTVVRVPQFFSGGTPKIQKLIYSFINVDECKGVFTQNTMKFFVRTVT